MKNWTAIFLLYPFENVGWILVHFSASLNRIGISPALHKTQHNTQLSFCMPIWNSKKQKYLLQISNTETFVHNTEMRKMIRNDLTVFWIPFARFSIMSHSHNIRIENPNPVLQNSRMWVQLSLPRYKPCRVSGSSDNCKFWIWQLALSYTFIVAVLPVIKPKT